MNLGLFGSRAKGNQVSVEFPTVANVTGVVSYVEDTGSLVDLYLATNRKQVDRTALVGKTIGSVFSSQYGGSPPTAYVMLKGSTSQGVDANYVLKESDVLEISQIKSTSQAASLA